MVLITFLFGLSDQNARYKIVRVLNPFFKFIPLLFFVCSMFFICLFFLVQLSESISQRAREEIINTLIESIFDSRSLSILAQILVQRIIDDSRFFIFLSQFISFLNRSIRFIFLFFRFFNHSWMRVYSCPCMCVNVHLMILKWFATVWNARAYKYWKFRQGGKGFGAISMGLGRSWVSISFATI